MAETGGPSWDEVAASARRVIKDFLDGDDLTASEIARAKIATSSLSAAARIEQSRRAYEGVAVMMARELATNAEERQRYIAATLPDHPMVREFKQPPQIEAPKD